MECAPKSVVEKLVFFDPQTSGVLLLSLSSEAAPQFVEKLLPHFPGTSVIGTVTRNEDSYVIVE